MVVAMAVATITIILSLLVTGVAADSYRSSFETTANGRFVGPEFWANPLQSWNVADGQAGVIGMGMQSGSTVNLQLLTHQIETTETSDFTLETEFVVDEIGGEGAWVGFILWP